MYQLKFNLQDLDLQFFSLAVISVLIAITYTTSPWAVFLVVALLLLVNASLRNYINLRDQAKQAFERIMDLLEKRDPYTHKHSESVGDLTEAIAEEMQVMLDALAPILEAWQRDGDMRAVDPLPFFGLMKSIGLLALYQEEFGEYGEDWYAEIRELLLDSVAKGLTV